MTHYTSLQLLAPRRPDQLRDCPFACPLSTQHKFFAGPAFVANYKLRGGEAPRFIRDTVGQFPLQHVRRQDGARAAQSRLVSTGAALSVSLGAGDHPRHFPLTPFVDYRKERVHQALSRLDRSRILPPATVPPVRDGSPVSSNLCHQLLTSAQASNWSTTTNSPAIPSPFGLK